MNPSPEPRIRLDLRIPLRDGVHLYGALYRPAQGERFPVIYAHTIYSTLHPYYVDAAARFARAGYAVLLVDSRGRYESEGVWHPYFCEAQDAYDVQQWVGRQPWCDGALGMFGRSYVGFTQILPAPFRCPHVKALVPMINQEDNYGHHRYNGVLQLQNAMNFLWLGNRTNQKLTEDATIDMARVYRRLPLISALDDYCDRPFYREIIRHNRFDEFWKAYSMKDRYDQVETPAYFMTGWYDNLLHEGFKCFRGWTTRARSPEARRLSRLLVGPWMHGGMGSAAPFGDVTFGAEAGMDLIAEHLRWYDRRLRGLDTGIDADPPVRIFVMGANAWRFEGQWPPARTRHRPAYLHSSGRANSLFGDGRLSFGPPAGEPADAFAYDPRDPVPTHGGQSMFPDNSGPRDRRSIERRDDVLVYTSEPLTEDLEVTGEVELVLYAASSAPDTDFTAALVDVHPNGTAIHICEGIVRARFRESYESPSLIEPGEVYEYRFSLWETSNLFRAGHRIRLEVSSSNFPRFDRNLNTGHEPGLDAEMAVARQTVYHDQARPSHLRLPVIAAHSG
jgi:putative CocE/NonD family hydrolase